MFAFVVTLSALFGGAVSLLCPTFDPTVTVNVAHPTNCAKYMSCVYGNPYEMPCPDGLEWNDQHSYCDYSVQSGCVRNVPEEVARLNGSALAAASVCLPPEVSRCPEESSGINEVAFVKHKDCRKFVACSLGRQSEMRCPVGLYWNAGNCRCDYTIDEECDGAGERPMGDGPEGEVPAEGEPNVDGQPIPEEPVDSEHPKEPDQDGEDNGPAEDLAPQGEPENPEEPNKDEGHAEPAEESAPPRDPEHPEEPNQDEGQAEPADDLAPQEEPENPEEPDQKGGHDGLIVDPAPFPGIPENPILDLVPPPAPEDFKPVRSRRAASSEDGIDRTTSSGDADDADSGSAASSGSPDSSSGGSSSSSGSSGSSGNSGSAGSSGNSNSSGGGSSSSSGSSGSSGGSGSSSSGGSSGSSSSSAGNQPIEDDGPTASGAETGIRGVAAFAVMMATLAINSL